MKAEISFYLSLFRRRIWWFVATFAVITAIGVGVAMMLPPTYATSARLVVESEKIPDELAASTVQTKAVEHLEIIEQRILAREALLEMATRLRIYGTERPSPNAIVSDLRSRITFKIEAGQRKRNEPEGATMLSVGFTADTGIMAASVTNELVTRVLAEDVEMRTSVARQTLDFFDQEVGRLEDQLSRSGATLLAFQQENRDVLPETQDMRSQRVLAIQSELSRIEREIDDLARERRRLVRLHQSIRRTQSDSYRDVESYEARQLAALRETLDQLPEGDPGRADISRRIASLTKMLADQGEPTQASVRRTAFHDRVDEIDERIRAEEDRRLALVDELQDIQSSLALTPTKAAQLASLEQDHSNLRSLYDQALESRALAETGDTIESLSKGQRIAVIEQAGIPLAPASPNRKMVALGGSTAGVMLGLLLVALLELRLGFLRRPVDLHRRLGITPIATLPNLDLDDWVDPAPVRQKPWGKIILGAAFLALIAGIGIGIATDIIPGPLDLAHALRRLV